MRSGSRIDPFVVAAFMRSGSRIDPMNRVTTSLAVLTRRNIDALGQRSLVVRVVLRRSLEAGK
jgi:hypothetical protein